MFGVDGTSYKIKLAFYWIVERVGSRFGGLGRI